jgi:hypothetical protein
LQVVRVIEPALQKFYQSLSDEQKERLNLLDAQNLGAAENPDPAQLCSSGPQLAKLPIAEASRPRAPTGRCSGDESQGAGRGIR